MTQVSAAMAAELHAGQELYRELLAVIESEGRELREAGSQPPSGTAAAARQALLPRLNESLDILRRHRVSWTQASPEERARHPQIAGLLRQSQDLIMKIIVQDRENEQALLRRGLVPPQHLPSANRQRPHYVADLYRRQFGDGA
ncbi:MAG TPA: hypothetical protein DCY13_02355 [Verrucomicrobiales bacterium]|nr:hypothetical protein [Verrucomicrobiales bacterium]